MNSGLAEGVVRDEIETDIPVEPDTAVEVVFDTPTYGELKKRIPLPHPGIFHLLEGLFSAPPAHPVESTVHVHDIDDMLYLIRSCNQAIKYLIHELGTVGSSTTLVRNGQPSPSSDLANDWYESALFFERMIKPIISPKSMDLLMEFIDSEINARNITIKLMLEMSNGTPVDEDQKHLIAEYQNEKWLAWNRNIRQGLLWLYYYFNEIQSSYPINPSEILTVVPPEEFADISRLRLSFRALDLLKSGKLDVRLPTGVTPEQILQMHSDRERRQVIPQLTKHDSEYMWDKCSSACDLAEVKLKVLQKKLLITLPAGVVVCTVRYGTVASFTNVFATLIQGMTHYPEKEARAHLQAHQRSIETDRVYGTVFEQYDAWDAHVTSNTSTILIRINEDEPKSIDEYADCIVEEMLHILLFPLSAYFQIPHAWEELIVKLVLEKEGLHHSGTPVALSDDELASVMPKLAQHITEDSYDILGAMIVVIEHLRPEVIPMAGAADGLAARIREILAPVMDRH